jgi:hypothetical protein
MPSTPAIHTQSPSRPSASRGIHLAYAWIGPSRQGIELGFADEDDKPVFFSTPGALNAGMTWKINGGDPLVLTHMLRGGQCGWVFCPTCADPIANYVVDDHDGSPGFTTTGAWTEVVADGSHPFNNDIVKNNQYRTATWSSPSATAVYTFTGLTPGRFDVLALLWEIVGPDRASDALYTVKDGSGATLGTFPWDQTRTLWPRFDRVVGGYDYTRLGYVTLPAGQDTITVTLSQTGGSGILATDAIALRRLPTPPIGPGDTATITIPEGTIVSDSGPVVAVADFPIALVDDSVLMPFDPAPSRRLKVGYNISGLGHDGIAMTFADRGFGNSPWEARGGTIAVDSDGELTAVTGGVAVTYLVTNATNGIDGRGLLTFVDGTTIRAEFDFVPTESQPVFDAAAQRATKVAPVGSNPTLSGIALANTSGNHWRLTTTVHHQAWTPVAGRPAEFDRAWSPNLWFQTGSVIRNLEWYDDTAPVGYAPLTHRVHFDRLAGKGFGFLRLMDILGTNNSKVVDFSDFPPPSVRKVGSAPYIGHTAVPVSIRPYDTSVADADRVQAIGLNFGGLAAIVMQFATPHGIKEGQEIVFTGPVTSAPGLDATTIYWSDGLLFATISGVIDTELICFVAYSGPYTGSRERPDTLTGTVALSSSTVSTHFGSVHPSYYFDSCAELGLSPWVNIPPMATDACCASLVDLALGATAPGMPVYVEYGNEMWNGGFHHWLYAVIKSQQYIHNHSADPVTYPLIIADEQQWYAYRSSQHFDTARARAVAAGRPPSDIVRVLGAQTNYVAATTQSSVPWMAANGKAFDRLTIFGYMNIDTIGQGLNAAPGGSVDAAIDRLDEQGRLDLFAASALRGDLSYLAAQHRAILDAHGFQPGSPNPVSLNCYEAGFSHLGNHGTVEPATYMTHLMAGDPRSYRLMLAVFQHLDAQGFAEWGRYTLDYNAGAARPEIWATYLTAAGGPGTGTPGENANVVDYPLYLSQEAGAHLAWAAGVPAPAPTPTPEPTPTPTPTPTPGPPTPEPTPGPPPPVSDTIGDRIAEAAAAAAALAQAQADSTAAATKVAAASDRAAKAAAALTEGLARVGPAYRRDAQGDGLSVYLPDGAGNIKTIRPAPPATVVPAPTPKPAK